MLKNVFNYFRAFTKEKPFETLDNADFSKLSKREKEIVCDDPKFQKEYTKFMGKLINKEEKVTLKIPKSALKKVLEYRNSKTEKFNKRIKFVRNMLSMPEI